MKYHLDTNTLSALIRGDDAVRDRLAALGANRVSVSQPALAELAYGVARLPDSKRKRWLQESLDAITGSISRVEWTDDVTAAFGMIKASLERRGELIGDFDVAIAAHAVAADATLVTADARHMPRVPGLTVEDWSSQ